MRFEIAPDSLEAYRKERGLGRGNPLMAPFANRIDREHYFFQGKKYLLNDELGNFIRAGGSNLPIHGLLAYDTRWEVVKSGASDKSGAFLTARIEFYKYPELMAQFPFAHTWEITYRLKDGQLECTTSVQNVGNSPMPVHYGYHPYFVPDGPRTEWRLHSAARKHWIVDDFLIPSGELEPAEQFLPGSTRDLTLGKAFIDGGFTALVRDRKGLARFWVAGKNQKIEVVFDLYLSSRNHPSQTYGNEGYIILRGVPENLQSLKFLEPVLIATTGASGGFEEDGRPRTYRRALRLIERGQIEVAPLITHRYPSLDALPRAFSDDHAAPDYVKGVVTLP